MASQHVLQGTAVMLPVRASDLDADSIAITATGLPTGLRIDTTDTISGTVTEAGSFDVVISASDGQLTTPYHLRWHVYADADALNEALMPTSNEVDHQNTGATINGVDGGSNGGTTGNTTGNTTSNSTNDSASAGRLSPSWLFALIVMLAFRMAGSRRRPN